MPARSGSEEPGAPAGAAEQPFVVVVVVVVAPGAAPFSSDESPEGVPAVGPGRQIESAAFFGVHFSPSSQTLSSVQGVRQIFDTHVFEEQSTFTVQGEPAVRPGGVPSSRAW
jgi:hypothetical protein